MRTLNTLDDVERFKYSRGNTMALAYKVVAVSYAPWYKPFSKIRYRVGETVITNRINLNPQKSCSFGLHVAAKVWLTDRSLGYQDAARLLLVKVRRSECVFPNVRDGKIRTTKVRVVKEISLSELQ